MAGYSAKTARQIASQNLSKLDILEYIEKRLDELAMTSKEVLVGLTIEAKGSISDILEADGSFDYEAMCERGADKLLKELKVKRVVRTDPATKEIIDETTHEFKMYDAQNAKVQIGKARGLFIEKHELTGRDGGAIQTVLMSVEEYRQIADERLKKAQETADKFAEKIDE